MKQFNLEAAKAGAPIVTRDGREAKFVTHIPEASEGFRVVWMQRGIVGCSYENGKLGENIESRHDLFMKPQKRKVWINLFGDIQSGKYKIYETRQEAEINSMNYSFAVFEIAMEIEIEE